jgi:hypothetical protein
MRGDSEVTQLQLLVLAYENIERRQIAMHGLAAMQGVERAEDGGDLATHKTLRLRSFSSEPAAQIPVLGVFHRETVSHSRAVDDGKTVQHPQSARLAADELREVRLAKPRG